MLAVGGTAISRNPLFSQQIQSGIGLLDFGISPAIVGSVVRLGEKGWSMKVQNMIRMTAAMIAFAAALFLASATPAQEITNTEWPDRPGATEPLQAAPAANAVNTAAAPQAPATASTPMATQQASATQLPLQRLSIAFLLLSIAAMALYARAEAKETDRKFKARIAHVARSVSLS